ncbi:MAG: hypothetical protein ACE5JU_16860 [Candidatus Binatia bacterium]
MKITIDLSDEAVRRAKGLAAAKGITLKHLLTGAIEDKLCEATRLEACQPPWMKLYGAFAKSTKMRAETRRLQDLMDAEFERINPEAWK